MDRLTCKFDEQNVLRAMCTFDRESETEPDDCITCDELANEFCGLGCERCAFQKAFDRLAAYEDTNLTPEQITEIDKLYAEKCREVAELKKQIPPCKVGDTVYWVSNWYGFGANYKVYPEKADQFIYDGSNMCIDMSCGRTGVYGKNVFLTQDEAEEALKRMEGRK